MIRELGGQAAFDQLDDELAELGERLIAPPFGARLVEPRPALARAALEHLPHGARLRERRAQERAEGAPQLGATRAPASGSCHRRSIGYSPINVFE
jgi:hypothetical protein